MLKTRLLHPEIAAALAAAGHSSQVLIADANYPASTEVPATARRVHLNLAPGMVRITDVLAVLLDTIPIEAAVVMLPPEGTAEIHAAYRAMLPAEVPLDGLDRYPFYEAAKSHRTALVVVTGETRRYANLLLTIGAVKSHADETY